MSSYNRVILMGNLTRDPELRYSSNNLAICKVGLAVNRRVKDAQTGKWGEEPTFVDITIFDKRAEAFAKYFSKGRPALIEGSLRFDSWEDKEGNKRSKLYVVADNWEFVGSGGGEGGGYSGGGSASAEGAGGGNAGGGSAGGYDRAPQSQPAGERVDVDDTPF